MISTRIVAYTMMAIFIPKAESQGTFDIPVTFNPLVQSAVERGANTKFFYKDDPDFYSKVTVIDAAINAQQAVKEMIKKTISVVFLTVASSHVSLTLNLKDLLYTKSNKWTYTLSVQDILDASNGEIVKLNDKTVIYKIQESAMKVLEKRFDFTLDELLPKLEMTKMEFYGIDDKQWITAVGIITEKVIKDRSEKLNLTSCYLAEMVNTTLEELYGFTLNEVDMYLYNTRILLAQLPSYYQSVLEGLYTTFNVTAVEFAAISNVDISADAIDLEKTLKLFSNGILTELHVTMEQITQRDKSLDTQMILRCTDKWEPFQRDVVEISFSNVAQSMSITNQTLSLLIELPQTTITAGQMYRLLSTVIQPLMVDKNLLETSTLSDVLTDHGIEKTNIKESSAFSTISMFTNFTERHLTILYGWKQQDYQYASLFTLDELAETCSLNYLKNTMYTLATINIGGTTQNLQCRSFKSLRGIWEEMDIRVLKADFSPGGKLQYDVPISKAVSLMTNASATINNRVLNVTSEVQKLLEIITFNNISTVAMLPLSSLLAKSFQDIIQLVIHLHQNGSFDHIIPAVSFSSPQSKPASTSTTVAQTLQPTSTTSAFSTQSFNSFGDVQPTKQSTTITALHITKLTESLTQSDISHSVKTASTISAFLTQSYNSVSNIQPTESTTITTLHITKLTESLTQSNISHSVNATSSISASLTQSYNSSSHIQPTKQSTTITALNITKLTESLTQSNISQTIKAISPISSIKSFNNSVSKIQPTKRSTTIISSHLTKVTELLTPLMISQPMKTTSAVSVFTSLSPVSPSNTQLFENLTTKMVTSQITKPLKSLLLTNTTQISLSIPFFTSVVSSSNIQPTEQSTPIITSYLTHTFESPTLPTFLLTVINAKTTSSTNTSNTVVNTTFTNISPSQNISSASSTMISFVIQTTDVIRNTHSSIQSSTLIPTRPKTTTSGFDFVISSSPTIKTNILQTTTYTSANFDSTEATVSTQNVSSIFITPSKTKPETRSSVTEPVNTCKQSCKTDQICTNHLGKLSCIAGQNLQAGFKITNQDFDDKLDNLFSTSAINLSRKIEAMIDSAYEQSSVYSSFYIGSQVINFKQGSVIVSSKLSFKNSLDMTNSTIAKIQQIFVDTLKNNTKNFTIDDKTISVKDFDECLENNNQTKLCRYRCKNTPGSYECTCPSDMKGDGKVCQVITTSGRSSDKDDVPWIIYVVIAIMVLLIIFLIMVIIYCEKKHKKKYRPQVLDFHNGGINMYPRSTSYLAQTPESEADLADGLGIVNRRGPAPNMVTFNPTPEEMTEKTATPTKQPGVFQYRF